MEGMNESSPIREALIHNVMAPLTSLVQRYEKAHVFRDGLKLAIVGKPNVGKSSLMNRLLQKERVIVTAEPGTTRDVIEETLNIHGIPVIMMDTAGLHDTDDPIETMGMEKTHETVDRSDLVLFMVEAGFPLAEADMSIYERIKNRNNIIVVNKIDRVDASYEMKIPEAWRDHSLVRISALYDRGLSDLKALITQSATGDSGLQFQSTAVPNLRHKSGFRVHLEGRESGD